VRVPALGRDLQVVGAGYQLGGKPLPITAPPPAFGHDTEQVLLAAGLSPSEIVSLGNDGAISLMRGQCEGD
jgi:hypothetical protein